MNRKNFFKHAALVAVVVGLSVACHAQTQNANQPAPQVFTPAVVSIPANTATTAAEGAQSEQAIQVSSPLIEIRRNPVIPQTVNIDDKNSNETPMQAPAPNDKTTPVEPPKK